MRCRRLLRFLISQELLSSTDLRRIRAVKTHKKTRIVITTIPRRVNVFLNGVLIGQTPLDTFVNAGNNVVMTLSKTGFYPVRVPVALRTGETLPLTLRLKKQDVWRPYVP